jgi:hypothetical protein
MFAQETIFISNLIFIFNKKVLKLSPEGKVLEIPFEK